MDIVLRKRPELAVPESAIEAIPVTPDVVKNFSNLLVFVTAKWKGVFPRRLRAESFARDLREGIDELVAQGRMGICFGDADNRFLMTRQGDGAVVRGGRGLTSPVPQIGLLIEDVVRHMWVQCFHDPIREALSIDFFQNDRRFTIRADGGEREEPANGRGTYVVRLGRYGLFHWEC